VMVPGKTHISLTVAWALDHDPVAAVKLASNRDAIPEDEAVDLQAGDQVTPPPPATLPEPMRPGFLETRKE